MFAHKTAFFSVIVGFNLDSQAVYYDEITETNIWLLKKLTFDRCRLLNKVQKNCEPFPSSWIFKTSNAL